MRLIIDRTSPAIIPPSIRFSRLALDRGIDAERDHFCREKKKNINRNPNEPIRVIGQSIETLTFSLELPLIRSFSTTTE